MKVSGTKRGCDNPMDLFNRKTKSKHCPDVHKHRAHREHLCSFPWSGDYYELMHSSSCLGILLTNVNASVGH